MTQDLARSAAPPLSLWARSLGVAGLIPQILLTWIVVGFPPRFGAAASALALAYSGLILSFIGGAWWGLAAVQDRPVSRWLWVAAISPSLIGFAAIGAWAIGAPPRTGLILTGTSLIAAIWVDIKFSAIGLCPRGWVGLRIGLSLALGGLTLLIAVVA